MALLPRIKKIDPSIRSTEIPPAFPHPNHHGREEISGVLQIFLEILQHSCKIFLMLLHPRKLLPILKARLARWPITVLTGARQTRSPCPILSEMSGVLA